MTSEDTIFARASGAGKAGVAVFRISGEAAHKAAELLTGRKPEGRQAVRVSVKDPATGHTLDEGLLLLFHGPASFTGEDVAELHLHGSLAVEAGLYRALSGLGLRAAEAGEFTRRALLNGKLDLAAAEGLADLIDAETMVQRQQALGQLGGRLSILAEGWRTRLISIAAPLEAEIDFPDEEDVPAAIAARAGPAIDALLLELEEALSLSSRGQRVRSGVLVVLLGAPNAGKSSLLNRLSGDDRAIVSPEPGTTRDIIEARLDLGGVAVTLADTAGLREVSSGAIEDEGMKRAQALAARADITVLVMDGADKAGKAPSVKADITIFNKIDLKPYDDNQSTEVIPISAKTGEGVEPFLDALTERAISLVGNGQDAALTRVRHASLVKKAICALEQSKTRLINAPELAAEDVRLAIRALGELTGAVRVDDVLEAIFSSFCIGK